jgi:hypothetical protein
MTKKHSKEIEEMHKEIVRAEKQISVELPSKHQMFAIAYI